MTPQVMASAHAAAFTQSRPWSKEEFANLLANRFTHYVGTPQAFALFQVIAGEAELLTIAIHPNYQRRGLGRQCMITWQNKAAEFGAVRAFLEVAADNLPARALYQNCRYRPCGLRKGYYARKNGQSVDAIIMDRRLP